MFTVEPLRAHLERSSISVHGLKQNEAHPGGPVVKFLSGDTALALAENNETLIIIMWRQINVFKKKKTNRN